MNLLWDTDRRYSFLKNNTLLSCFSEDKMGCHRTGEDLSVATGWPGRAGLGRQQSNRGVALGSCTALWEGSQGFGGAAYFLTAYFFICFIQLLQRVQQFLWGENVCGSWEGREDSELTHLLQPEASFCPRFSIPPTLVWVQWKLGGVWGWKPWAPIT